MIALSKEIPACFHPYPLHFLQIEFRQELSILKRRIHSLEREIGNVLILTEGKTDWMHLKNAWSVLKNGGAYPNIELKFAENEEDMGESKLESLLKGLSRITRNNIVIGIFDNDSKVGRKYAGIHQLGNNVFACCICDTQGYGDEISIELLYKREDLLSVSREGRRLFLSDEFSEKSHRLLCNKEIVSTHNTIQDAHKRNIIKVVDGSVFNANDEQIALSKADFAKRVIDKIPPFDVVDVSGFCEIFNRIASIVSDNQEVENVENV